MTYLDIRQLNLFEFVYRLLDLSITLNTTLIGYPQIIKFLYVLLALQGRFTLKTRLLGLQDQSRKALTSLPASAGLRSQRRLRSLQPSFLISVQWVEIHGGNGCHGMQPL